MQEEILDDLEASSKFFSRLTTGQWQFLIFEFTLLTLTLICTSAVEYWTFLRVYLSDFQELLGLFILFYIGAIPFFNKSIEPVPLRIVVGIWLLINYGLVSFAMSRGLWHTLDILILVLIVLSYTIYAIKAPRFEAKGKGVARTRPLTLFYLTGLGVVISVFSLVYKKPMMPFYYLNEMLILSSLVWMIYLIYKNKDDFDLLLYLPRILLALFFNSLIIYLSFLK